MNTTEHSHSILPTSLIATTILATVEATRLQKAVEGFVTGAYQITLASQSAEEIRGFVANGDGKEYGVVLGKGAAFCSCKDAMYRKGICKHSVILALFVIRTPQPVAPTVTRPLNLKLAKVRRHG